MTQIRNKTKETRAPIATQPTKEPAPRSFLERFDQPGRRQTILLCLALFLVAMGFNLYRIGVPSIWFDEALSVTRAQQSLPILLQIISVTQPNMAIYYILLHFWLQFMGLFGLHATETIVRLPSAVFSALGTLVLYFMARRFLGSLVALFVALFYLLNTLQLTYAQETRAYTLQLFLLGLSWYALCVLFSSDLSRKRARNWWICFIVASALAMYAQLFTELVLATQAVAIVLLCTVPNVWRRRTRRALRPLLLSWLCIGILIAPILYASRVGSKTGWLPIPHLRDVYHLFLTISAQSKLLLGLFVLLALVGLVVSVLALSGRGQKVLQTLSLPPTEQAMEKSWQQRLRQMVPLAIVLICWLVLPVAISYIVSQKSTHLFSPRYLVVIVPAMVLLAGLGLSILRWRTVQLGLGLCLVLLCVILVPVYYNSAQVEDWRTGTQWLQQNYQSGDGLICYDNSEGCEVDIDYYLQAYPQGGAHFDADSPGYFPWVNYDTTNVLGNYRQALDTNAIQTYASHHPRIFYGIGRASVTSPQVQTVIQWLNAHYRLLKSAKTGTLTLYLYDTTAYEPHLV